MNSKTLIEYSDKELQEELERRGYCTSSLWCDEDVQSCIDDYNEEHSTSYEIEMSAKMQILNEIFGTEGDKSSLNEEINDKVIDYIEETFGTDENTKPKR